MPITLQANGEPLLKRSSSYSHSFPVCNNSARCHQSRVARPYFFLMHKEKEGLVKLRCAVYSADSARGLDSDWC